MHTITESPGWRGLDGVGLDYIRALASLWPGVLDPGGWGRGCVVYMGAIRAGMGSPGRVLGDPDAILGDGLASGQAMPWAPSWRLSSRANRARSGDPIGRPGRALVHLMT